MAGFTHFLGYNGKLFETESVLFNTTICTSVACSKSVKSHKEPIVAIVPESLLSTQVTQNNVLRNSWLITLAQVDSSGPKLNTLEDFTRIYTIFLLMPLFFRLRKTKEARGLSLK